MSRTLTPVKSWAYRFDCKENQLEEVLTLFGSRWMDIDKVIAILVDEEYRPLLGAHYGDPDDVRSFRFTFEATDGQIRKMLRSAVWAVRRDEDHTWEWEHTLIESFGTQMKEQGFPRVSA